MKMFFNVERKINTKNFTKDKVFKVNNVKRRGLKLFNLNEIMTAKYKTKCGACSG